MRISSAVGALLVLTSAAAGQQGTLIEAGREYRGSARLQAPLAGMAFTLPDGFAGAWDDEVDGMVFEAAAGDAIAAVWGWSEATVDEIEGGVGYLLEAAGIHLEERGQPEGDENGARGFFNATTEDGPGLLYAVIRRGDDGNAIAVAALGAQDAEDRLVGVVDGIVESVELARPAAAGWRAEVEGTVLSLSASGSDYSTGGSATGSSASESNTTLALCRGARYRYSSVSETYISIPGASASSESRDEHAGAWWLIADLAGNPSLWLEVDDGRTLQWEVREDGDAFVIDGSRYVVSGSC